MVESSQVRDRVKEQQTDSQRRIRVCSRLRERSHLSTTEASRAKARAECSWRQGSSDRSGCCSLATARATQSITHWYLMQRETPQGPVQNRSCIVQGLCCFCSFEELLPRCEDTSKTPPGHFLSARIGFVAGCPVQMKFRFWDGGLEEEALAWVWVDAQLACATKRKAGPASWSPLPAFPLTNSCSWHGHHAVPLFASATTRCPSCLLKLFQKGLRSKTSARVAESQHGLLQLAVCAHAYPGTPPCGKELRERRESDPGPKSNL
jgi:hypothetical protein